jgi:hypothetical protein
LSRFIFRRDDAFDQHCRLVEIPLGSNLDGIIPLSAAPAASEAIPKWAT